MKPFYTFMFFFSLALVAASIIALGMYGLNFGVDFTGGSVLEMQFSQRPAPAEIISALGKLSLDPLHELTVNPSGEQGMVIKSGPLTEDQHQQVLTALKEKFAAAQPVETRFDSVGPTVGSELKSRSLTAIVIVLVAIVLYIALVFRAMRRVLSPWGMGLAAIIALAHDVLIPLGLFALLGHFAHVQISAVFVAAILTILGYSVSDTVVIFDRVRENILRGVKGSMGELMHMSVMQTLVRSINNTLTVMLSSLAIFLFGGDSIRYFALALLVGVGLGAYSSIFVASPLLVWLGRRKQ
jgi:preprotein translocase subunit SecF